MAALAKMNCAIMNTLNNRLITYEYELEDNQATQFFAQTCAHYSISPLLITLQGPLGVGKTTLVRYWLQGLGIHSSIKSPTFSIVEIYNLDHQNFYHLDLYRLANADNKMALEELGIRDALDHICFVEWPEYSKDLLARRDCHFNLSFKAENYLKRTIHCQSYSEKGFDFLTAVKNDLVVGDK